MERAGTAGEREADLEVSAHDREEAGIRLAQRNEARALTDLAMRSKAHWGYDTEFMARAAPVLTVTAEMIAAGGVGVLQDDEGIAGLYVLSYEDDGTAEFDMLFVEPARLGGGCGGRLFTHARAAARKAGARQLIAESDPNAVGFYERMGMKQTGTRISPVDPARELPLLTLDL